MTLSAIKASYWAVRRRPQRIWHILLMLLRFPISAVRLYAATRQLPGRRRVHVVALLEHMGDIMAAEPIARLARRVYSDRHIIWVTRKPYASLAQAFSGVDSVFTVSCLTEWALLWQAGIVTSVWDLHFGKRTCPQCALPITKPGPTVDDYFSTGSLLECQCEAAGLARLLDGPVLIPPHVAVAAVDRLALPQPFVVVHCRSNERTRDWSAQGWQELLTKLAQAFAVPIVEVGSVATLQSLHPPVTNLCGGLSMLETAEVIRRSALFIGIDSGPAHLANAVGTPGVILLGEYRHFYRRQPFSGADADGSNAELIYVDHSLDALAAEDVFTAVCRRLNLAMSNGTR